MRRPIAVLFDLDGTLLDTVPFILSAVRHAFEGYPRAPTDAEWIEGIGTPLRALHGVLAREARRVHEALRRRGRGRPGAARSRPPARRRHGQGRGRRAPL